jgi:hypothetical protein
LQERCNVIGADVLIPLVLHRVQIYDLGARNSGEIIGLPWRSASDEPDCAEPASIEAQSNFDRQRTLSPNAIGGRTTRSLRITIRGVWWPPCKSRVFSRTLAGLDTASWPSSNRAGRRERLNCWSSVQRAWRDFFVVDPLLRIPSIGTVGR